MGVARMMWAWPGWHGRGRDGVGLALMLWACLSHRCCDWLRCCGGGEPRPRTVWLGHPEKRDQRYPRNVINNQKYNFFTFLPGVRAGRDRDRFSCPRQMRAVAPASEDRGPPGRFCEHPVCFPCHLSPWLSLSPGPQRVEGALCRLPGCETAPSRNNITFIWGIGT